MLFNEPKLLKFRPRNEGLRGRIPRFSALQRAEIAEIERRTGVGCAAERVSVLFNEPKLLKSDAYRDLAKLRERFSALQRAEIAEIDGGCVPSLRAARFQCSSTSRNC